MPTTTDLLIGSYPNLEAQTLSVRDTGTGTTEGCVLPANSWYLYDDLSAWDLLEAMSGAIESHSILNSVSVLLGVDLRVHIVSSLAFTMTWPADNVLRNLLGFTGALSPSSLTHTASRISPLLWSPGKPTTWLARVGTDGIPVREVAVGQSGPGTVRATLGNEYRRNELIYRYLLNSKMWTPAEENGEYFVFFREVCQMRRRFKVWSNYPEDLTDHSTLLSPADAPNPGPIPSSGAYICSGGGEMPWGREFNFVDSLHPLTIPVVSTREYDAP